MNTSAFRLKRHLQNLLHAGLPVPRVIRPVMRAACHAGILAGRLLRLIVKMVLIEPMMRSICESVGAELRIERLPYLRGPGRLTLGRHVYLSGRSNFFFMSGMPEAPRISVGDDTFIGHGCTFSCARAIRIGNHVLMSTEVRIHDNDGHPLDPERRRHDERIRLDEAAPVTIEDNVWIGAGAVILKGVTIGTDSVVGAGAVVTDDVPSGVVVAGNPARVIKSLRDQPDGITVRGGMDL